MENQIRKMLQERNLEESFDALVIKQGPAMNAEQQCFLAENFKDKKLAYQQLTNEMLPKFSTRLQEQIFRTEVLAKASFTTPDMLSPNIAIGSDYTEQWKEQIKSLTCDYITEALNLKRYFKDDIQYFAKFPLNHFEWNDLKITLPGEGSEIQYEGDEPSVVGKLRSLINAAREHCEKLRKEANESFKALKANGYTYNYGIYVLNNIVKNFNDYLLNSFYLDDALKSIDDAVNEAASSDLDFSFSIWKVLVEIYKTLCYKCIEVDLFDTFAIVIRKLLEAIFESKIDESKLYALLMEKEMLMLKEVGDYFVDMKVTKYNIRFIKRSKPKIIINFDGLIIRLSNQLKDLIHDFIENKLEFVKIIPVYKAFFKELLIPQISHQVAKIWL